MQTTARIFFCFFVKRKIFPKFAACAGGKTFLANLKKQTIKDIACRLIEC